MIRLTVQLTLIALLFLLSAYFAGTETGVYRLSRLRLRIGAEQNRRPYQRLTALLRDGQGLILALLVGNNLVNYGVTALVTVMLLEQFQNPRLAEIYATAILTPTLFMFGEIIPKILYYHKANSLMPSLAPLTWFVYHLFTLSGVVPVLKGLSRLLSFGDTAKAVDVTKRHQVRQILHETQEEGLLSDRQKEMMGRLVDLGGIPVGSVMVPLAAVEMVDAASDAADLLAHLRSHWHTRQLVYDGTRDRILGVIDLYEMLASETAFDSLRPHVAELPVMDRGHTVLEGINQLRDHPSPMALVIEGTPPGRQRPVGIVTLTDLVAELTGELA